MAVSTGKVNRSLDLKRAETGRLREHHHLIGGHVGHGVDRQAQHRGDAGADDHRGEDQDEKLVPQREVNQLVHDILPLLVFADAVAEQG